MKTKSTEMIRRIAFFVSHGKSVLTTEQGRPTAFGAKAKAGLRKSFILKELLSGIESKELDPKSHDDKPQKMVMKRGIGECNLP